ncbi:hypothetical protein B0H34DRAFT_784150 [Crassisporium funariophilum]|nr:hypothetical protein B0H34DRAFT_784150 [Crassisporium funariophilum]
MSIPATTREYSIPQVGSYKSLVINEASIAKPRSTEVLVKIHAVSLQFRDIAIAAGYYPITYRPNMVPCSDMAGSIIALGTDVTSWKVGDRVSCNFSPEHLYGDITARSAKSALGGEVPGVLTEYRNLPARALVRVPHHLSYEDASTLPCAAVTAYNALNGPIPVKAGDSVLVLGTGGVSTFALQFAVASGAIVITTSSSDGKLQTAAKLGAHHLVNYQNTPEWDEEVLRITEGRGVDHVFEVGGLGTLQKSLNAVRVGGSVHIIGVDSGNSDFIQKSIVKSISLRGIHVGSHDQFLKMLRLINAHPEKTRPVIDSVFPFERAIEAYERLESRKHVGKVVIRVAKE